MGFLAAAIPAIATIAGSVIGGNAQKAAAANAANQQNALTQQQLAVLQQQQQDSRNAIFGLAPYSFGAAGAAGAFHQPGAVPFLRAGQGGATFGGQHVNATPTGGFNQAGNGVDYSALLANNQPGHTQMVGGGFLGGGSIPGQGMPTGQGGYLGATPQNGGFQPGGVQRNLQGMS